MKLYREKSTGKKLYPVCSWEDNQHKLYNAHDRIMNAIYDDREAGGDNLEKLYNEQERVEQALSAFDAHVINDLVYASYENSLLIKRLCSGYDARH